MQIAAMLVGIGIGSAAVPLLGWWVSSICLTAGLIYAIIGSAQAQHNAVGMLLFALAAPWLAAAIAYGVLFILLMLGIGFSWPKR